MQKIHSINVWIYYLILMLTVASFAVLPFRNVEARHSIVFLGSLSMYVMTVLRLIKTKFTVGLMARILLMVVLLFFAVASSKQITLERVYVSLDFFAIYILLSTESDFVLTDTIRKVTLVAVIAIAILLFIIASSPVAYVLEDGRRAQALALGSSNPNLTAMLISGVIYMLILLFPKGVIRGAFQIVLIGGLIYLLVLTESRSSLVSVFIIILYVVFFRNRRIPTFLIFVPILFSILFVPIYLYLFEKGVLNVSFIGKEFYSGRQFVYQNYLRFLDSPLKQLLGDFDSAPFTNAHNAALTILCAIGPVGLALAYYGFTKQIVQTNNKSNSIKSRLAIVSMLCIFIQSSAESLMLTGVFPGVVFLFLFGAYAKEEGLNSDELLAKETKRIICTRDVGNMLSQDGEDRKTVPPTELQIQ